MNDLYECIGKVSPRGPGPPGLGLLRIKSQVPQHFFACTQCDARTQCTPLPLGCAVHDISFSEMCGGVSALRCKGVSASHCFFFTSDASVMQRRAKLCTWYEAKRSGVHRGEYNLIHLRCKGAPHEVNRRALESRTFHLHMQMQSIEL